MNLKLSVDGEKAEDSGSLGNTLDIMNKVDFSKKIEEKSNASKLPILRRRKHIFVIAVDTDTETDFIEAVKSIFDAACEDRISGSIGFVLSTALTISEIHSVLMLGGIPATDFDAFICNSGSELYYPSANSEDLLSPFDLPFDLDLDYNSQIEFRWGGDGLRKTLIRWAATVVDKKGEVEEQVVIEDKQRSASYCHAFEVRNPSLVKHFSFFMPTAKSLKLKN